MQKANEIMGILHQFQNHLSLFIVLLFFCFIIAAVSHVRAGAGFD
jgi:hypothetical protein